MAAEVRDQGKILFWVNGKATDSGNGKVIVERKHAACKDGEWHLSYSCFQVQFPTVVLRNSQSFAHRLCVDSSEKSYLSWFFFSRQSHIPNIIYAVGSAAESTKFHFSRRLRPPLSGVWGGSIPTGTEGPLCLLFLRLFSWSAIALAISHIPPRSNPPWDWLSAISITSLLVDMSIRNMISWWPVSS